MSKNITPHDNKGNLHGYCEDYWSDGNPFYKGTYRHGWCIGYWEHYYIPNGVLTCKTYYIK